MRETQRVTLARILFIGDSITLGLGATGLAFPRLVEKRLKDERGLETQVWTAAINGGTAAQHKAHLHSYVDFNPDLVVAYLGTVEAIPRPRRDGPIDLVRLLPRRYQQPGWLQPRPYLPTRWLKRNVYAIPESFIRTRVNRAIMRLQGAAVVATEAAFRRDLVALLSPLLAQGANAIVCGVGPVDGSLFPGADLTFPRYRAVASAVAVELKAEFVDVNAVLTSETFGGHRLLLLDKLHPNVDGHAAVASALMPVVLRTLRGR